ncbi:hypothetical protein [Pelosinus sp. HCF1]|nr:hypothetical protein [Pelosinus sp. HCF1]
MYDDKCNYRNKEFFHINKTSLPNWSKEVLLYASIGYQSCYLRAVQSGG